MAFGETRLYRDRCECFLFYKIAKQGVAEVQWLAEHVIGFTQGHNTGRANRSTQSVKVLSAGSSATDGNQRLPGPVHKCTSGVRRLHCRLERLAERQSDRTRPYVFEGVGIIGTQATIEQPALVGDIIDVEA